MRNNSARTRLFSRSNVDDILKIAMDDDDEAQEVTARRKHSIRYDSKIQISERLGAYTRYYEYSTSGD